jgi:peptidoglycan/LPS O-acetylase OafA/YrhL
MGKYIPSLNGLRALSIAVVIYYHLTRAGAIPDVVLPYPLGFILDGNFGVNVFFVISGFLITTILIAEERYTGTINLKNFYIRRVFRIFPAYYFVLLVYFVLQLLLILSFSKGSWLSSIFYYKYLAVSDAETNHFWSLSVEEHFYIFWPLIFLLFRRARLYFAFGVILLVFCCRFLGYHYGQARPLFGNWVFIFQRVDAIMIGCLFAMYKDRIYRWMDWTRRYYLSLPLLLLALFINSPFFQELNQIHGLHLGFALVPLAAGESISTIGNVLIAILILFSISRVNKWYAFLNLPVMNYIGKLSYSLYLWQQLFILSSHVGILSKFPIDLICCFLAANFSYYVIELPFLKLKSRFETVKVPRAGGSGRVSQGNSEQAKGDVSKIAL